jgi:SAM-dependent methyltransferase
MFTESAEIYDLIYAQFKNYAEESERLAALIRRVNPQCHSVLDVACGTGEHMRYLATDGFRVDGIDLDERFVQVAARKNPLSRMWCSDMASLDIGERYDAVLCLFSSIAYVRTFERLVATLRAFRRHLNGGGVIVVEPWFGPGQLDPSFVMRNAAAAPGLQVERVSHLEILGRVSRLRFDYSLTDSSGVRHATEIHDMGLFTTAEMLAAFTEAGLAVEHDETGLDGRGLFIGRAAA